MRYFDIRNDIFLSFYEEFECESYLFMIDFRIFFVPFLYKTEKKSSQK